MTYLIIFLLSFGFVNLFAESKEVKSSEFSGFELMSNLNTNEEADLKLFDRYILRLRNNEGEKLQNAWVSLMVVDEHPDKLKPSPPIFYEYQYESEGLFRADIYPFKVDDKKFKLFVHADGHNQYEVSFKTLRKDITVILQKK